MTFLGALTAFAAAVFVGALEGAFFVATIGFGFFGEAATFLLTTAFLAGGAFLAVEALAFFAGATDDFFKGFLAAGFLATGFTEIALLTFLTVDVVFFAPLATIPHSFHTPI